MKNWQFFKNFQENFAIFSKNFWKFIRIFGENVDKNLENLEICTFRGVRWAEPPDASEFMEIWEEKSMETINFLKNFMHSESIFCLTRQF